MLVFLAFPASAQEIETVVVTSRTAELPSLLDPRECDKARNKLADLPLEDKLNLSLKDRVARREWIAACYQRIVDYERATRSALTQKSDVPKAKVPTESEEKLALSNNELGKV